MDILIKNMGKPQYCYAEKDHYIIKPCPFLQTCYKEWRVNINAINVHSDACPLVELPPHGELKDEMDIIHRIEKIADADLAQDIIGEILASPTILEASNGSDN